MMSQQPYWCLKATTLFPGPFPLPPSKGKGPGNEVAKTIKMWPCWGLQTNPGRFASTVEPRFNEVARDRPNLFVNMEILI